MAESGPGHQHGCKILICLLQEQNWSTERGSSEAWKALRGGFRGGGGGSWWYFPCMQSDPKTQVQPPHSPLSTCPPPPPMLPSVCPSDPPLHLMTGDLPALKPLIFNDEGGWGRLMDPAMLPIIRQTLLDIRLFGNVLKVQELPIFWNKMQI